MKKPCKWKVRSKDLYRFISVPACCEKPFLITNFLFVMLIFLFTFSCGKSEKFELPLIEEENVVTELEVDNKMSFKMHMNDLEDYYDDLEEAIEIQNWEKIKEYAKKIKNTSPVAITGREKGNLPRDFIIIDTKYHLHTLKLVEAAEEREMVRLNIEYDNLKRTCDDCHEKYKKK